MMDKVSTEFTYVNKMLTVPFNGILQILVNVCYGLYDSKRRTPTPLK